MALYVFTSQREALLAVLDTTGLVAAGSRYPKSVDGGYQLSGLTKGHVLAVVKGHPNPVPDDIMEHARMSGMIIMDISDEFARALALRASTC